MAILGAHMSIAGGYHKAVERAASVGCECVQVFTKNCNQWAARDITKEQASRFRQAVADLGIRHTVAHDSYLINLASPDEALWKRSVDALVDELRRADALGIPLVVTHPGAYTTGTEERGLCQVARALDAIQRRTKRLESRCVLETTAGQGTSLGWRFEQFGAILGRVRHADRIGICFDTCHVFAAGYRLKSKREYRATMAEFERIVGLDKICVFHVNDSQRELGSRVDRHAHIGCGEMGLEPFRHLLSDKRFELVPMILETPKGGPKGRDMDRVNLRVLGRLIGPSR